MYDFVDRNKRIVQIILALIMVPFALFGVDSYLRQSDREQPVATVGGQKIVRAEYENAMRDQTERFRSMLGRNFNPAMFDSDEIRGQVLDGLVNQRLVKAKSDAMNFTAPDAQVRKVISEIPNFQEDGKFSAKRYEELLRAQGQSPAQFEQSMRAQLAQQPIQDALAESHFVSNAQTLRWMQLNEQQREISIAQLPNQVFQAQVNIDDATAKAHYEKNTSAYQSPEQVKLEYMVLTQAAVAAQVVVDPAKVKEAYDTRSKELVSPEERQASHILVKDKKKADELLTQVTANPAKFAELAKANSEDPGSKDQGGDLGFFGRGAMVKPFEEAVYAMKKDEIRGPIASDFGFHVIKLTGVKGGTVPPFEEVKAKLESDLRNAAGVELFGKLATSFNTKYFSEADSFKSFSAESKVLPTTSQWLTRGQVQAISMGNQKMVDVIFDKKTIADKVNTEPIEIGANTLMSARVLEHKPAATRPFDEVKADVVGELKRKGASALAQTAGDAQLAKLRAGDPGTGLQFAAIAPLSRTQRLPGLNDDLVKAVFNAPSDKLPSVVGGLNEQGGYSFVRISKVIDAASDEAKLKNGARRVAGISSGELTMAYLASLKSEIKTTVNKDLVNKKADGTVEPKKDAAKDAPAKPAEPKK